MKIVFAIQGVVLASALSRCQSPDGCTPLTTRCKGNTAEICDANRYWVEVTDCDQVSRQSDEPFVCAWAEEDPELEDPAGYACVPEADLREPETSGGTQ